MNTPSSTITFAGLGGLAASAIFLGLAIFAPEIYERAKEYPGAEGVIAGLVTTAAAFILGYIKKETVLKVVHE